MTIELHIAGTPHGRPRPRSRAVKSKKSGKWISVSYHPRPVKRRKKKPTPEDLAWERAHAWFAAVATAAKGRIPESPWTGPVSITCDVYFERPKRLCRKKDPAGPIRHIAKPDRDNLDKAILDALKHAGLFIDDSQVCDGLVRKWYAARGCGPGVIILAEQLAEAPCLS